ncbi:MAG: anti-sigma regulatory factor [Deltaproteobacteria bacterium]|nr:anti-sigma regulatory factor [Deltaproteobacteria bacterium]
MLDDVLTEESWCIDGEAVVDAVRQRARELASQLGMERRDSEAVAIAVSELGYNIALHAGSGQVVLQTVQHRGRRGFIAIASDAGPGIDDIQWALTDGCTSGAGLGCGLPAVRRLMDEFCIDTVVGKGTTVTVRKWTGSPDERG